MGADPKGTVLFLNNIGGKEWLLERGSSLQSRVGGVEDRERAASPTKLHDTPASGLHGVAGQPLKLIYNRESTIFVSGR